MRRGDLLRHIEKKSDYYLSCVFTIIREWHVRGKPRTHESRHDFREWSQTLDWIIQNIFKLPPLLDGHREEQRLFRESEELVVEGFVVKRIQKDAYDEIPKENRSSKFYRFTQVDR
jgi:hypothetical protein